MHSEKLEKSGGIIAQADTGREIAAYEDDELIEMYGRLDPTRAPALSEQVKDMLIERGFVFEAGDAGREPEFIASREKLKELIGVGTPIRTPVFFGDVPGRLGWLQPARNDFHLVGDGIFEADGVYLKMYGPRNGVPLSIRNTRFLKGIKLNWRRIVDVEVQGNAIRLGYQVPGAADAGIDLWFPTEQIAAQIAAVLPKTRTKAFQPLLSSDVEYQNQLLRSPPKSAATLTLLAANVLLFIAAALGGAGWIIPHAPVEIAAGANLGTLTLHGQWWRLISALFLHAGIIHLAFNMWALAAFGALAERLFGIKTFLGVYFVSGVLANLAGAALHPSVAGMGASAAIFGVLGAVVAVYWRKRKIPPYTVVRSERTAVLVFAVGALLAGFAHKGLDNAAHLVGLATGLLCGAALLRAKGNRFQTAAVSQNE